MAKAHNSHKNLQRTILRPVRILLLLLLLAAAAAEGAKADGCS